MIKYLKYFILLAILLTASSCSVSNIQSDYGQGIVSMQSSLMEGVDGYFPVIEAESNQGFVFLKLYNSESEALKVFDYYKYHYGKTGEVMNINSKEVFFTDLTNVNGGKQIYWTEGNKLFGFRSENLNKAKIKRIVLQTSSNFDFPKEIYEKHYCLGFSEYGSIACRNHWINNNNLTINFQGENSYTQIITSIRILNNALQNETPICENKYNAILEVDQFVNLSINCPEYKSGELKFMEVNFEAKDVDSKSTEYFYISFSE